MWFSTSSGKIELNIPKRLAVIGSHSGPCDEDIAYLRTVPVIRRQLQKLDLQTLAQELEEYGAWDKGELADREANLSRILWIACADILEGR